MYRTLFFALLLLTNLPLLAQHVHLSGKVFLDLETGLITCDFTLSNIPDLGKDYQLLLNKGFNIKHIKDKTGKTIAYNGFYDGKMRGEGLAYTPTSGDAVLNNPKQLSINYTGAFPIYRNEYNFVDFKGLIAFNGETLRAAEQSKWYPIVYDVKNDQQLEEVTFDITVESKHAHQIFINGDLPKVGPIANFKSTAPVAPLLFVGHYRVQQTANAIFLNTAMSNVQLAIFEREIAEIKAYFSKVLSVPYNAKNVFIQHKAVEQFYNGRTWGFASYPTIAIAGSNLGQTINETDKKFKDSNDYAFYAHELAHYYFGNLLRPNSTLSWFFLESTAEYLSVKASEAKFGKNNADQYFKTAARNLKNFKATPLNKVKVQREIDGDYRYLYGPLLLRGLEQTVGEKQMFAFLKQCLTAKGQATDYTFFKEQAIKSGISAKDWDAFEQQFINSENVTALIKF